MGNQSIAKPSLDTLIQYKTVDHYLVSYRFKDLKGKQRFRKIQSTDSQIIVQFKQTLALIDASQNNKKRYINMFSPKYMHRFSQKHQQIINQLKEKKQKRMSELSGFVSCKTQQFAKSPSIYILKQIYSAVQDKERALQFLSSNGLISFMYCLQQQQARGRHDPSASFNFRLQILKILRKIQKLIPSEFQTSAHVIKLFSRQIVFCLHPVHLQLDVLVYEIFNQLFWERQIWSNQFQQSLSQLAATFQYNTRYEIFVQILSGLNIVLIGKTIQFINQYIESLGSVKQKIKAQLAACNMHSALQIIQQKINAGHYKLQACRIDNVAKSIEQNKMINGTSQIVRRYSIGMNIAPLPQVFQQQHFGFDGYNQLYLKQGQNKQFQRYLSFVRAQIRLFFNPENEEDRFEIPNIQNYFRKVKQYCIINGCLENLINLFQKLQNYDKDQWSFLQKKLKILPTNFVGSQKKLMLKIQSLQNQLKFKQIQLKSLVHDNTILRTKVIQLQQSIQKIQENKKQVSKCIQAKTPPPIILPPAVPSEIKKTDRQTDLLNPPTLPLPAPPSLTQHKPTGPSVKLSPPKINLLPPTTKQLLEQQNKSRVKSVPNVPLKLCTWSTIPFNRIQKTIWQVLDDSRVILDTDKIQRDFSKVVYKANLQQSRLSEDKKQSISLLSMERTKVYQLILSKLRLSHSLICQSLYTCDQKYLSLDVLQSLKAIIPTDIQVQTIIAYQGDTSQLDRPQQYILSLVAVDCFKDRILGMRFTKLYKEMFQDLSKKINKFNKVLDLILKSPQLKGLLQAALSVGNYLNGQSSRGGAWGFQFQHINKLKQIKSNDGSYPVGLLMMDWLKQKYDCPLFSNQQIDNTEFAMRLPISNLNYELNQIRKGLKSLRRVIEQADEQNKLDKFKRQYEGIMLNIIYKVDVVRNQILNLQKRNAEAQAYLCQSQITVSQQFYGKVYRVLLFTRKLQQLDQKVNRNKYQIGKLASQYIQDLRKSIKNRK